MKSGADGRERRIEREKRRKAKRERRIVGQATEGMAVPTDRTAEVTDKESRATESKA